MSLTGIWHLSMATPIGEQKVELELVQEGDTVTGVSRNELEGEKPLLEPSLVGDKLSWKTDMTKPMRATAKMEITIKGDTVTGSAKVGMFPSAKITGRRG
jgi:hypothetical protein